MWNQKPSFRFEIDNFSEKETFITSQTFVGDGCEWYISVYPKGDNVCDDHLCVYLHVANRNSLLKGWKRIANYYFLVLNHSEKELGRSPILGQGSNFFCAKTPGWGWRKTMPLSKFQESGFLENDRLIIEVYIQVVEAVDGNDEAVDINPFQTFASHVRKIFAEKVQKTEYKIALSNAYSKLSELAEVGSKIDWLKSKIDEISLKRKKADDVDGTLVQQLEERIKNLELMESSLKMDSLMSKLEEICLEQKKSYEILEERVKNFELMESGSKMECLKSRLEEIDLERKISYEKLEEHVKNCELMEPGFKIACLKAKLEEIDLERKKSYGKLEERVKNVELMGPSLMKNSLKSMLDRKQSDVANGSRFQRLEERVKNLELMELELKKKFEEVSLERKRSDDANGSQLQQHEESIKNLELMISELKVELEKEKVKSFDDGFLLVD